MVTQTHHFRVFQTNSMRFFKQISTINSMIFKTMDNELKVFGKTILTTTEHLKNLETVNATVYNKNGQFNLQGLSVNTSQSVSNFTKLNNAFKAYNGNLTKSTQLQNAYIKAVGNQNGALGNYLAGLNGAKASMGGYIKSLIGAKAATIGLQVASTLLNTALSFGLSLALSAIVSGITHLVNKEKEAREQAIENAQTAKEEADNLTELLNKYNQLSEEVKTNTGVKDDLLETQGELLESLGIEQSQIDGLIKKYGDLNTAINKVTLDSLNDAQADLMVAVDAREKELINVGKDYKHWFSLTNRNLISTGGEESKQAYDILAKAGVISQGSVGTGGGVFTLVGDDKTVDGILENYQKLKEAQTALNEAVSNGEISKEDMGSNPLYKAINSRLDELKTAVDDYNSAIKDVNENSANQEIISNLIGKDLPQTEEEFETFKQSLIDSAQASNNFIGSQEDIKNSIIDALAEMPEFEKYFEDLAQAESDVQHETPISTITTSVQQIKDQLSSAFKELGNAYQNIFTKNGFSIEDVDNDMLSGIKSAFEELEGFDTSNLDKFFDTLTNSASTADQVQQAFNDLATTYFYSTDTLNNLNNATAESIEQQLEEMGVANAHEVVYDALNGKMQALALQKQFATQTGYDLINATSEEAVAFLNEAGASETARGYLLLLIAQEQVFSNQDLNVEQKIQKLQQLASEYGNTALAASVAAKMEEATKSAATGGSYSFQDAFNEAKTEFEKAATTVNIDFKSIGGGSKSAGSAGKEAGDAYLEAFEKELGDLDDLKDRGIISEKEYLDRLRELYQRYFKDKEKYVDQYQKYEKKYLDGMYSLYNSALSGITKLMGKQIDKYSEEKEVAVSALEEERDARLAVIDAQKEQFQSQIDLIEKQIDEKQKEIDAINDAADARKRELDLQKAQYELERARNQRTKLVKICQTL